MNSESIENQTLREDKKIIGISQDTPVILSSEMSLNKKIGGGQYGAVWLGTCRGKEVAIKKFFKQDLSEKSVSDFKKEVEICCRIHHPNVVLFMGACIEPGNLAIVTELVPKGNLESLLHDPNRHYSLYSRLKMALDVAKGVNWLHCSKPPIIHRDLKPSNLLVDEYDNIKVCDFGFSTIRTSTGPVSQGNTIVGSPLWMAPEIFQGKPISEKADVYSFGIVLSEMVTLQEPFPEVETFAQLESMVKGGGRPVIPDTVPASIRDIIKACWRQDASQRPSFTEIIDSFPSLLIDSVTSDTAAKDFWRTRFATKEWVPWEEFVLDFYQYFVNSVPEPDSPEFKCLKLLLAKKSSDNTLRKAAEIVTLESFGNLLSWFGPIDRLPDPSCKNILQYIKSIAKQKWFHGHLSMTDASNRLSSYSKGHFLVRLSSTVPGQFTISKVDKSNGSISHQRIVYDHNELAFSVRLKDSKTGHVRMVVETKVGLKKFVSKISSDLGLVTPCPGRSAEFEQIFMKARSTSLAGYVLDN